MPTRLYPLPEFEDRILRRKDDTATADPDWPALMLDPGTFVGTVGGVADAGDVTVEITPLQDEFPTPDPIVFAATVETIGQTAEAVYDLVAAALDPTDVDYDAEWAVYLAGVSYVAAGTAVYFRPLPDAPPFIVVLTGTGGTMTFVVTPDDVFPITSTTSNVRGVDAKHRSELAITFVPVTSGDVPVPDDAACTVDVELVRVVERKSRFALPNEADRPVGCAGRATTTAHPLHNELRVPFDGGRWGIRLSALTNPPTGVDAVEVRWRQVAG